MELVQEDAATPVPPPEPADAPSPRVAPAPSPAAPKAPLKPARSRSGLLGYVALAVIVVGALFAYGVYRLVTSGHETTDDAQVDADVVPLSSRVGGPVLHLYVGEGKVVKKGDPLLDLDSSDYEARERQAEAELAAAKAQAAAADAQVEIVQATAKGGLSSAQAQLSGSAASVRSADAQIQVAQAGLARAQADARKVEADFARAQQLRATEGISQQQLDAAQAARDAAEASLLQAQANLAVAQESRDAARQRVNEASGHLSSSEPIDAQIAAARAQADLAHARMQAAEAAQQLAALQLSYTHVVSPVDGRVSNVGVREGQLLQPGQAIAQLVPSVMYVTAMFKETQVGNMKIGQEASVWIDAYPGRRFSGKVAAMSGGTGARFSLLPPDNASGNFVKVVQRVPVKIDWGDPPPDVDLRAGLSAVVTVYTR